MSSKVVRIIVTVVFLLSILTPVASAQEADGGSSAGSLFLPLISFPDDTPPPPPTPPDFRPVLATVNRSVTAASPTAACLEDTPDDGPAAAAQTGFCPVDGSYWGMQVGNQTVGFGGYTQPHERKVWKGASDEFSLEYPLREVHADVIVLEKGVRGYDLDSQLFEGESGFVYFRISDQSVGSSAVQQGPSIFEVADFSTALKELIEAGNDMAATIAANVPFYETFSFTAKTLESVGETATVWVPNGRVNFNPALPGIIFFEGTFQDSRVASKMGQNRWVAATDLMAIEAIKITVDTYRATPPKGGRLHFAPEGVYVLTWTAAGTVMYYGVKVIQAAEGYSFSPSIFLIVPERLLNPCYDRNGRNICEITNS